MLSSAGTRAVLDLNLKKDRATVRRFAQRLLDICDWWELKGQ
jgi:hypothetical protein